MILPPFSKLSGFPRLVLFCMIGSQVGSGSAGCRDILVGQGRDVDSFEHDRCPTAA